MGVLGFMVFGGCYLFLGIMIKKYYIHNVERLEAHTTVNIVQNNVLNVAPVQACEEADACAGERRPMSDGAGACAAEGAGSCEAERLPAFEEAVPEYLRTGKLFRAWEGLRKAGLLTESYRLAEGVPHAAAYHIAWCFGQKRAELIEELQSRVMDEFNEERLGEIAASEAIARGGEIGLVAARRVVDVLPEIRAVQGEIRVVLEIGHRRHAFRPKGQNRDRRKNHLYDF